MTPLSAGPRFPPSIASAPLKWSPPSASCSSAIAAKSRRSKSQPHPTFENTVLPLEQLSHRLSRTWSPISHLNGVLNSDELRASYNACLPLLSNYWTDLAQSEPLFRAYTRHRRQRGRLASIAAQRRVIERALEDFRLAGVGLPAERKARYKTVVQELAHARRQVRRKRARRDERVDAPGHRRARARRHQSRHRRAGARARRRKRRARAGCSRSSSPPTSP